MGRAVGLDLTPASPSNSRRLPLLSIGLVQGCAASNGKTHPKYKRAGRINLPALAVALRFTQGHCCFICSSDPYGARGGVLKTVVFWFGEESRAWS